jgi:hypothetical protein
MVRIYRPHGGDKKYAHNFDWNLMVELQTFDNTTINVGCGLL